MNGKMKTGALVASVLLLALAGAMCLPSALNSAWAEPGNDPVAGSGSSLFVPPNIFKGTMNLTIGGEAFEPSFEAALLGQIVSDEGVLHGTASHTIDFGDGNTLTTDDDAVLEPTETPGLFTLNERMTVVSGTGDFADASGQLHAHGMIHLYEGWALFEIRGAISR